MILLPGIGKKALTRDGGAMANFRRFFRGSVSSGALRSGQTAGSAGFVTAEILFLEISSAAAALAVVLLRVLAVRTVCLFRALCSNLASVKSIIPAGKGFSGRQGRRRRNTAVLQGRGR